MSWLNIFEISKDVHWVGVRDWNRRLFDALIPLPMGTSYNSYLIVGEKKSALIDTVNPGFEKELEGKINKITDPKDIDYIVMNHAEPDHAGSIPYMMLINSNAVLVTNARGAKMVKTYFGVPDDRLLIISDQDTIDLGSKTLRFIEAPMLHWPETIFTYLKEDKILFPCDFFGSHIAKGVYAEDFEDLLVHAQRYFGEIMMPFKSAAKRALEKIKDLDISIIAPSHGPIHKNTHRIINAYNGWANGETRRKVTIVYATMWKNTEKMIKPLIETLMSEGVELSLYDLVSSDVGEIVKDLVDSKAIVLGAPTVLNGMHPLAFYAAYLVKALRPPLKFGVFLSSYGWGGGAKKQFQEMLGSSGIDVLGAMEINGPPSEKDVEHIIQLGKTLAVKIKENKKVSG
jgi:flavorubredoxin